MRLPAALLLVVALGSTLAFAQTPAPAAQIPDTPPALASLLALDEPGAQLRGLEAYVTAHPKSPGLSQIYAALLEDATQLNDDHRVLLYNEKLQDLDPGDLAQRIKTLNLLMLETDAAHRRQAQRDADTLARMVEAKAAEPPPAEMGAARWRLDLARLRSVAALFQGSAAQALGQWPQAETYLVKSLQQSQSQEAAEHLANVYVAENKIPQAIDTFALALALPGETIADRAALRAQAGTLYRSQHHGSEAGFGDLILQKFDQVAARDADEQHALAPSAQANANAQTAAQFRLTSLDGAPRSLAAAAAGKLAVLDFWATWCGPCKVQHPLLEALRQRFATDHNVIFIAVNEDEDPSRVAPFLAAQGWDRATWLDAGLAGFLNVDSLPTTLILDPKGAVVYRQEGLVPDTFETQLGQAIQAALARAFPAAAAAAR